MRWGGVVVGMGLVASMGCVMKFSSRSPWDIQQLAELSQQLEQFKELARLNAEETEQLRRAKTELEARLGSEHISVGYDQRGLVTRMLDTVLFDSGKAQLRKNAYPVLDKVAQILNETVSEQPVVIEGHTDNEPIQHSGWKDNRELSVARANAVLRYLVDQRSVDPSRIIATGYGEERPVLSNDTPHGRQKNRRVEIIITPREPHAAGYAPAETMRIGK